MSIRPPQCELFQMSVIGWRTPYTYLKINIFFKFLFILHSEIIERSIRSEMNQGECRKPHLPLDNPDIMKFYEPVEKIKCGSELDWVMCEVCTYMLINTLVLVYKL